MNIVFLYSVLSEYMVDVIEEISILEKVNNVFVVHWPAEGINATKYEIRRNFDKKIHFQSRSEFYSTSQIRDFLINLKPSIIYCSGWMDSSYLAAIKQYKRITLSTTKVVAGIDDQWHGNIKQYLRSVHYRIFLKGIFDFLWVAGAPQYHYARMLGVRDENIIYNLLSASRRFEEVESPSNPTKRFIFVGRLDPVKNLRTLLNAYTLLPEKVRDEWRLEIIGDGEQRALVESFVKEYSSISYIPFLQPEQLAENLEKGGVGILPSSHEQWGVVVHEFANLGLPIICSSKVGAKSIFLIEGLNGFAFNPNSPSDLTSRMLQVSELSDNELASFGSMSRELAKRINSRISAYSLMSVKFK